MRRRVLVTGANRGIGLELVRAFTALGHDVYATVRSTPLRDTPLEAGAVGVFELDLNNEVSLEDLGAGVADALPAIDVLVNNAGVGVRAFGASSAQATVDTVSPDLIDEVFRINTIGPLLVTRQLMPLLNSGESPLVCNISSQLGSMVVGATAGDVAYNISKAALNMITVKSAAAHPDVTFVALHPGWVRTDMGGDSADLSVEDSAAAIAETLLGLTSADSGRFLTWDGRDHPW